MSDAPLHLLGVDESMCGRSGITVLFPTNVTCKTCIAIYGAQVGETKRTMPRHEQVTALKDASAGGLSGEYVYEWVGQLNLRSADRLIHALHEAGYELVKK